MDSAVAFLESTLNAFGVLLETDEAKKWNSVEEAKELIEVELKSKQGAHVMRAEKFRKFELPLSIAAVSLFALGYLWVVGYVFVLCRSVR